jgi:hypothetical protein
MLLNMLPATSSTAPKLPHPSSINSRPSTPPQSAHTASSGLRDLCQNEESLLKKSILC